MKRKVQIRYCPVWPTKKYIAARVAEQLKQANDVEVEVLKGGFLELSVGVDGEKMIDTNRLWYPLPSSLLRKTRELLDRKPQ